ncbi:MAG: hypothetical protein H6519_04260 [Microthrixaceae bacterium]|nr:hypothetical protein [Microthrixaceae bacterium]
MSSASELVDRRRLPSASYLAALAAGVTVLSPSFSPLAPDPVVVDRGLCLVRVFSAVAVPLHLTTTVALGILVGP